MKTLETDKLREEFKSRYGKYDTYKRDTSFITRIPIDLVFNFFLPHLSVSKEVEVSDEDIEKEAKMRCTTNMGYYWALNAKWFRKGCKWMRDRKGIAPKEVKEKKLK